MKFSPNKEKMEYNLFGKYKKKKKHYCFLDVYFFSLKMRLLIWASVTRREGQTESSSTYWLFLKWPQWLGLGHAECWSQEFLPTWEAETQALGPSCSAASPRLFTGSWVRTKPPEHKSVPKWMSVSQAAALPAMSQHWSQNVPIRTGLLVPWIGTPTCPLPWLPWIPGSHSPLLSLGESFQIGLFVERASLELIQVFVGAVAQSFLLLDTFHFYSANVLQSA